MHTRAMADVLAASAGAVIAPSPHSASKTRVNALMRERAAPTRPRMRMGEGLLFGPLTHSSLRDGTSSPLPQGERALPSAAEVRRNRFWPRRHLCILAAAGANGRECSVQEQTPGRSGPGAGVARYRNVARSGLTCQPKFARGKDARVCIDLRGRLDGLDSLYSCWFH